MPEHPSWFIYCVLLVKTFKFVDSSLWFPLLTPILLCALDRAHGRNGLTLPDILYIFLYFIYMYYDALFSTTNDGDDDRHFMAFHFAGNRHFIHKGLYAHKTF